MAAPISTPQHDLGSLRIHDGQRHGSKLGKGLAIFFGVLVILAGIAGGVYAFWNQKPIVQVAVVHKPVGAGGREALLNASGYVTPRRRGTLAAKITFRVTGVYFDEGTVVKENQLLATLDDSDVQTALSSAKSHKDSTEASIADLQVQLKNANIELHRADQLQQAGVQTQEQLDTARMNADSLKAKIELAKAQVAAAT